MVKKTLGMEKLVAGVAGAAALAAGAYYFLGKDGKRHQKAAKALAEKAKKEVLQELAKMEKVGQAQYKKASAEVLKHYKQIKADYPQQFNYVEKELKNYWLKAGKMLGQIPVKPKAKPKRKTSKKNIAT